MIRLRPHFLSLTVAFTALLGVVAAVNVAVDSKGALRGADQTWPALYAGAVMKSAHGLAWPDRQERSVKAAMAAAGAADCVVVGTSQVQMVRLGSFAPAQEGCHALINLWVTQGTLEDVVTMLAAVVDKPTTRRVYIGVAPWLFKWGANSGWTENSEAYERARRRFGLSKAATGGAGLDGIANVLNFKYFQANVRQVLARRPGSGQSVLRPAGDDDDAPASDTVMRPDGSMHFSRNYMAAHQVDWPAVADGSFMIRPPYGQPHAVADLLTVLGVLRQRGVEVTLVLAPYHPKVFECRNAAVCAALAEAEARAHAVAAQAGGVTVLGGYDPRPYGLAAQDFIDDMHLTEAGSVKYSTAAHRLRASGLSSEARRCCEH